MTEEKNKTQPGDRRFGFEIAVIGMAGQFPGAADIDCFWENLQKGVESLTFATDHELEEEGVPMDLVRDLNYVKARGGVLENKDCFDADFFGYTPKEAEVMDPQFRQLHQTTWHALEHAGYNPYAYNGRIGIYAGSSSGFEWKARVLLAGKNEELGEFAVNQLTDKDYLCTRMAYQFNLRGPSLVVQSACSTSLAAVHLACRALLMGECDMALAAGVAVPASESTGYLYQQGMIFSPDGRCRAFDARAAGVIGGSGVGVVVLKRLKHALADRDHIHALILGSAVNNDGNRRAGFTVPGIQGQAEVIKSVHRVTGVSPETIGYIEAHGTGTPLGDPIEIQALKQAFNTQEKGFCGIGSVKTNVGHLDAAAGITSLIKTVLALRHRKIPPSLHFKTPNPQLELENSPFYVNAQLKEWKNPHAPLRAGVSSFGMGGTNAHLVLEEPIPQENSSESRETQLIMLSAATPETLEKVTVNLADHLRTHPHLNLADVAYTLHGGRKALTYRRMFTASGIQEARNILEAGDSRKYSTHNLPKQEKKPFLIFLFPGLGSQYVNMGRGLYQAEPAFAREAGRCFEALKKLGHDIEPLLFPTPDREKEASEALNRAEIAQLAVFVIEYALARLLAAWGIVPDAMIGYSFGEYTAACLAGVFELEQVLTLLVDRGRCIHRMEPGVMISVPLTRQQVEPFLNTQPTLSLSIDNGASCILSGTSEAVQHLEEEMKVRRIITMRLTTDRAIHSHMTHSVLPEFREKAAKVSFSEPRLPYISNVTGTWVTVEQAQAPDYWANHLKQTVRFAEGIGQLLKEPGALMVEVGPGRDLTALVQRYTGYNNAIPVINLMRHSQQARPDGQYLLKKIGQLWLYGLEPCWQEFYKEEKRNRLPLPLYPFEKRRFQIDPSTINASFINQKQEFADWFYFPTWKRSLLPTQSSLRSESEVWLLFRYPDSLAEEFKEQLQQQGKRVITVCPGPGFKQDEAQGDAYTIEPAQLLQYEQLFSLLRQKGSLPTHILYLWGLTPKAGNNPSLSLKSFEQDLEQGFSGLIHLVQAWDAQHVNQELSIQVITQCTRDVTGVEILQPGKSTVIGPIKVIPQEYPLISCRHIDTELFEPGSPREYELVSFLVREITSTAKETTVAYRLGSRWVECFESLHLEKEREADAPLKQKGCYLVTGGLGQIGFMLARYLAYSVKARLVLVGRTPLPPRQEWNGSGEPSIQVKRVQELEALGAEVLALDADVSELSAMQAVKEQAESRFGAIHGIIHAAGILQGPSVQYIRELTPNTWQKQFSAKVKGLWNLHELFKNTTLDFCWIISSVSTVLGGLTFAAYVAANAFMDTFTAERSRRFPQKWVCVNWDGMEEAETLSAFRRILSLEGVNRVVASRGGDLDTRLRQWVQLDSLRDGEKQPDAARDTGAVYPRPNITSAYKAPGTPLEINVCRIWQQLFGFEMIGVDDDFFELGGDSLRALFVISRLQKELHVNVTISEFFKESTVAKLAHSLENAEKSIYKPIEPAEKKEYYPLSSAQERLYVLWQMDKQSIAYNQFQLFRLQSGRFNRQKMETAIAGLIKRHEALRTSIRMTDHGPVQMIHPYSDIEFNVQFFQTQPDRVKDLVEEFIQPFDLETVPFLRIGMIEVPEEHPVIMVDMHHLITDRISHEIFVEEFLSLYSGKPLPHLSLQYKDYSQWQNSPAQKQKIHRSQDYWLSQFAGELPVLNLPLDYPRGATVGFEGSTTYFTVEQKNIDALKQTALRNEATLFMVLLALFTLFLTKITDQEDIVVGTPTAGRNHTDLERIIGVFINMLALRNHPTGEKSFEQFLGELKHNTIKVFENQDYQFEDLVEKVAVNRIKGDDPLVDAMFVLQTEGIGGLVANESHTSELTLTPYDYDRKTAKFTLTLQAIENGDQILFCFEYRSKLFQPQTIDRFVGYFKRVTEAVIQDPGQRFSQIELLSEVERQQILYRFNDTAAPYPKHKTLTRLFEEQVRRTPNAIAIHYPPAQLTYLELLHRAEALAGKLQVQGVGPNSIVAVITHRSLEMMIGIYAILQAGAAYMPIRPDSPKERIRYLLEDSGASAVVCAKGAIQSPPDSCSTLLFLDDESLYREQQITFRREEQAGASAYVIYTSGSTGKPKGVIVEHRSAVNRLLWMQHFYPLDERDIILQKTPIVFDVSVWELFWWGLTGASLRLLAPGAEISPQAILDSVEKSGVTTLHFVPSMLGAFLEYLEEFSESNRVFSLKQVFSSGEALSYNHAETFQRLLQGIRLINLYGPTEATVDVSYFNLPDGTPPLKIPIGKPIHNTQLLVLGKYGQLQPIGIQGELVIAGDGLARGYLNNPGLTHAKFSTSSIIDAEGRVYTDRIYHTGDWARWLPDGNIEYLGRKDAQVKIRGFRIEPGEVEYHLLTHKGIKEAAVLVREGNRGDGKHLCAYIVTDQPLTAAQIRDDLSEKIPDYMIPSYFVEIPELPLTPNGKLDRKALTGVDTYMDSGVDYQAPTSPTEVALAEFWKELLEKETVGVNERFFDSGGNSLKLIRLFEKIKKSFPGKIEIQELFDQQTIKHLAALIDRRSLSQKTEKKQPRVIEF